LKDLSVRIEVGVRKDLSTAERKYYTKVFGTLELAEGCTGTRLGPAQDALDEADRKARLAGVSYTRQRELFRIARTFKEMPAKLSGEPSAVTRELGFYQEAGWINQLIAFARELGIKDRETLGLLDEVKNCEILPKKNEKEDSAS